MADTDGAATPGKQAVQDWVREYAERTNAPLGACKSVAQHVWIAAREDLRERVLGLCDRMEEGYCDVSDFAIEQIRAAVGTGNPTQPRADD